jgi:CheY-like chemotaxis protein
LGFGLDGLAIAALREDLVVHAGELQGIGRTAGACVRRGPPASRQLRPPCALHREEPGGDFELQLRRPQHARESEPELEAHASRPTETAGKLRVLVVDDEATMRLLCRVNLSVAGMEVLEAEDGPSCMEILRAERVDAILLDVMMPGVDGLEVARELQSAPATRGIPIIFLTARADVGDQISGYEAGALGYITKPFDPVQLAAQIEAVVAERNAEGSEELRSRRLRDLRRDPQD